jgi:hypothetical protein
VVERPYEPVTDSLELPKQQKMDMKFGTWNVKHICQSGSLKTVGRELVTSKLHLIGVQSLDDTRVALNQQMLVGFSVEMRMIIITLGQAFSYTREPDQQLGR